MIVYKVIVEIKQEIAGEWFNWMSTKHIPDVINTGSFFDFSFSKLLPNGSVAQQGYDKFEIRYFCRSLKDFKKYETEYSSALQEEHKAKYNGQFIAYRETYEDLATEMIKANKLEAEIPAS